MSADIQNMEIYDVWKRTFDSMSDLIMIVDTKHKIVRANKAMAEKLGLLPSKAVGITCFDHVHGLTGPPSFCPHSKCLLDGRAHSVEVYEERLGGHYLVTVSPVFDAVGKVAGSVHIARDITARKQMEEDLRRSSREKDTLLKEKEKLIAELREALATIKRLHGILPICASCKKIRDDNGYWTQVESYIREHSEAKFSHGICPDCVKKLYPGLKLSG